MKQKESNTEFLARLMEFSNSGALMQMFIVQALISYTDHVVANEAEVRKGMGTNHFIHPDAWMATAKELKKELDTRLPPPKKA